MVRFVKRGICTKSTAIVRKVDELGRVVIPIELRRTLMIGIKGTLEIFTEEDTIVLRRYQQLCCLCGGSEDLKVYKNKKICLECRDDAKKL